VNAGSTARQSQYVIRLDWFYEDVIEAFQPSSIRSLASA
jgi:hypothetical protein